MDERWGLAMATRRLLETADQGEIARRDQQVERAIAALLAYRHDPGNGGPGAGDDAVSDWVIILADHFRVPEDYFTGATVGTPIDSRRRREAELRRDLAESERELSEAMRATGTTGVSSCRVPRDDLAQRALSNRELARFILQADDGDGYDEDI